MKSRLYFQMIFWESENDFEADHTTATFEKPEGIHIDDLSEEIKEKIKAEIMEEDEQPFIYTYIEIHHPPFKKVVV